MGANDSVFMPVQAQDLEGPFSGFLKPPAQGQPQASPGPANVAGGIAMAANAFIQSAATGRIKAFEMKENEKLGKVNQLNAYMTQHYPKLIPAAQDKAMAIFNRAMGHNTLTAMDDIPSKGGKGTQGLSKKTKENAGDPAQAHRHFTNILKDIALGMVGGKMPKGAPEFNADEVIGQLAMIVADPKNTISGVIDTHTATIQNKLKGFSGSQQAGEQLVSSELDAISRLDANYAQGLRTHHIGPLQPDPVVGSAEWLRVEDDKYLQGGGMAPPPGPVKAPMLPTKRDEFGQPVQQGPAGPAANIPPYLRPNGSAAPPAATAGPPEEPILDVRKAHIYESRKQGTVGNVENVVLTGRDGKPVRTTAFYVENPEFRGWYEAQSHKKLTGDVRITSKSDPHEQWSPVSRAVKGEAPWGDPKKWYEISRHKDEPNRVMVLGEVADPNKPESEYQREVLKLRKDQDFSNKEGAIYRDFENHISRIDAQSSAELARIPFNMNFTKPEERQAEAARIEGLRQRQIAEQAKMRDSRLQIHYSQHGLSFGGDNKPTLSPDAKTVLP